MGVFFVTPKIKDIPFLEKFLKESVPEISYVIVHGQLNSQILEERITKFYNQKVNLLLSTNIIESGLDLPHVNTIIINRANMFSLSSLYQCKGRVGRSKTRGYAYLTYQNENDLLFIIRTVLCKFQATSELFGVYEGNECNVPNNFYEDDVLLIYQGGDVVVVIGLFNKTQRKFNDNASKSKIIY